MSVHREKRLSSVFSVRLFYVTAVRSFRVCARATVMSPKGICTVGDRRSPESHSRAGGWALRAHAVIADHMSTLSLTPTSYSDEQKPCDTEERVKKRELE